MLTVTSLHTVPALSLLKSNEDRLRGIRMVSALFSCARAVADGLDDTTRVAALVIPPKSLEIGQNSFIRCPSVRCNKCADVFDHVG